MGELTERDGPHARREGLRAIVLSTLGGLTVTVGIAAAALADDAWWQPFCLLATGIVLISLMRLAERHFGQHEAQREAGGSSPQGSRPDPLGLRRGYLTYQANMAGVPARRAVALVWGAWLLPLGFVAFLWAHALVDLASGAVPA